MGFEHIAEFDVQEAIDDLNERLLVVEDAITTIQGDISNIQNEVSELRSSIEQLSFQIETIIEALASKAGKGITVSLQKGKVGIPKMLYWEGKDWAALVFPKALRRLRVSMSPKSLIAMGAALLAKALGAPGIVLAGVAILISMVFDIKKDLEDTRRRQEAYEKKIKEFWDEYNRRERDRRYAISQTMGPP